MIGERCADLILAAFLVAATCPMMPTGRADESVPSATATYDCGTLALYNLLRLEGHPTDLATLDSRLSSPSPRGHSMQQLRDAARSFGLDLIGVRLSKRHGSLDRPALVFLKEGEHGDRQRRPDALEPGKADAPRSIHPPGHHITVK